MRWLQTVLMLALGVGSSRGVELVGPLAIEVAATRARVHWVTDVIAGTRLQVSPPATVQADKTPTTDHTATITGLQPGVTYTVVVSTARARLATNQFVCTATGAPPAPHPEAESNVLKSVSAPVKSLHSTRVEPARSKWGNPASLPDHFARHGGDFHAKDAADYARQAGEFLVRAKAERLPAKVDESGTLRVFDPKSGTFAAYNPDGTTKTFFKPGSRDYFERQPGHPVDLTKWK